MIVPGLCAGKRMSLPANKEGLASVLIIEGIHALNPEYTSKIAPENKFKIFISPIPSLQLDDYNVVKSTDHRYRQSLLFLLQCILIIKPRIFDHQATDI